MESATAIAESGQTIDSSKTAAEIEVDALTAAGFSAEQITTLQANGYTSADIATINAIEALSQSIGLLTVAADGVVTEETEASSPITKDNIIAISKTTLDTFVEQLIA